MSRKKIAIISLLLTIVLFALSIKIERKLTNYTPKTTVLIAIQTIDAGTELSKDSNAFIEKSVPMDLATIGTIKSKEELEGKATTEKIYAGEIVNKSRIVDKTSLTNVLISPNERTFSIPVAMLDDPFAGTLRNKDKVDILFTNAPTPGNPAKTINLVKKATVVGALDSSGKFLLPSDKNVLASAILFSGTIEDGGKVANSMNTGRFKLLKLPVTSNESKDILIQNGVVLSK